MSAADSVIAFVQSKLGAPYLWGGVGPNAYDCSGLVQAAYRAAGIELPRTAEAQWAATRGSEVPANQAGPGDLVFFGAGSAPGHVGVVVNTAGDMVDAPNAGSVVRYDHWASWPHVLGVTRPSGGTGAGLLAAVQSAAAGTAAATGATPSAPSSSAGAGIGKLGLEVALGGAGVLLLILGAKRFTALAHPGG